GIYGVALNGSNRTTEIVDTDAGQFDNDAAYDRAVGPMQFIPSTWSVLGTDAGRRGAVFRYNHSQSYVDLVLNIMDAYLQGDFTSIPNGTVMAGEITKTPPPLHVP